MDRKDFLKKSVVGITGVVAAGVAVSNAATSKKNNIDNEVVGFNHIPAKNDKKMNTVLHKANTRGHANHGWLDSHHSFSFANYYNPERMGFGKLRVLNDDRVEASQGFGTHPHNNMEIISIPLEGDLEHKDSTGNVAVIKEGDIQVMSAGTGIFHSEYNKNEDKQVKFLQIWVHPNKEGVVPRYDQLPIDTDKMQNQFAQILSPNADDEGVWIYQDAWFNMGKFDEETTTTYTLNKEGNGVYAFILEGEAEIESQALETRDGFGVWDVESLNIKANKGAKILLMEVPMA
jgi:redox-sensitive bicupin YhaK (pirin superfamily)